MQIQKNVYLLRSKESKIPLLYLGCPTHIRPVFIPVFLSEYFSLEETTKAYAYTLQEILGLFYVSSDDIGIILVDSDDNVIQLM